MQTMNEKNYKNREEYFSLQDFMQLSAMRGAQLLSGETRLSNKIARCNVIEGGDLLRWAKPGELLISSGYAFSGKENELIELLCALDENNICGLCLKVKHFHSGLPKNVLNKAKELSFPLIQLPMEAVFSNILFESSESIFEKRTQSFYQLQDRFEQVLDVLLREDNPEKRLQTVEDLLKNPVLILGQSHELLMSKNSYRLFSGTLRDELMKQLFSDKQKTHFHIGKKKGVRVHICQPNLKQNIRLIVLEYNAPLSETDHILLNRVGNVLLLKMKSTFSLERIQHQNHQKFIEDWLFGKFQNTVNICVAAQAEGYALQENQFHRVVAVDFPKADKQKKTTRHSSEVIYSMMRNLDESNLFCVINGTLILVVKSGKDEEKDINALKKLCEKFRYILNGKSLGFCVSEPFSVGEMQKAYQQALRISHIRKCCHLEDAVIGCQNLGVLYLLALLPQDPAIHLMLENTLNPLKEFDTQHHSNLYETLQMFLQMGCNTKKTALQMHIHYNTLVYRISKIKSLLPLDLEDMNVRLQLHLLYHLEALNPATPQSEGAVS